MCATLARSGVDPECARKRKGPGLSRGLHGYRFLSVPGIRLYLLPDLRTYGVKPTESCPQIQSPLYMARSQMTSPPVEVTMVETS
jgi:hypothetical protein